MKKQGFQTGGLASERQIAGTYAASRGVPDDAHGGLSDGVFGYNHGLTGGPKRRPVAKRLCGVTRPVWASPSRTSCISSRTGPPARACTSTSRPQGSQILPYDWFLALEQPDSTTPFRDNQNILKYRYLAQNPGPHNPDGLPVGFVPGKGTGRNWLGMTCAACHTAEVRLGTTAYRVDGGPTGGDVQAFLTDLTRALQQTQTDPAKFGRFAARILARSTRRPTRPS